MEKSIKLLIYKFLEKWEITCEDIERFLYILLNEDIQNKDIILSYFLWMLFNMDYKKVSCFLKNILKLSNPSLLEKKYVYYKKNKKLKTILFMGSWKKIKNTLNISTLSYLTANSLWASIIKLWSHWVASKLWSRDIIEKKWFSTDYFLNISHREKFFQSTWFMFLPIEWLIPKFDNVYWWKFNFITSISYWLWLIVSYYKTGVIMYWISFNETKKTEKIIKDFFKDVENVFVYWSILNDFSFDEIISDNVYGNFPSEFKDFIRFKLNNLSKKEVEKYIYVNFENKEYLFDQVINWKWNYVQNTIISINSAILLKLSGMYKSLDIAFNDSIQALKSKKVFDHFNNLKIINEELRNSN